MPPESESALPRNPWWLRRPDLLVNGAVSVAVLAAAVEVYRVIGLGAGALPFVGVVVAGVGAVVARRSGPIGLALALIGCAVSAVAQWDPIVEWTIAVFTLFIATLRGSPAVRAIVITAVVLFGVVAFESSDGFWNAEVLAAVAGAIAGGAAGTGLRSQQRYWMTLREHAREAIATRESEARQRVADERLRIARDLHDVLGHQVAVASMHLGAVEVTVRKDPDTAARSAADARAALRSVTTETQRILELLRTQDVNSGQDESAVAGLSSIEALIKSFEDIGLRVESSVDVPAERATQPAVGMTAYRVVQEALTNAHRHGDGAATVSIGHDGHRLHITVSNAAPAERGSSAPGSGYGLIGMRERVAAAGGQLVVVEEDHRFEIRAMLALDGRVMS